MLRRRRWSPVHEGWESVLAAYGITAVTLGAWFWMILRKLRRLDRERTRG
jgi:hypothetical protein